MNFSTMNNYGLDMQSICIIAVNVQSTTKIQPDTSCSLQTIFSKCDVYRPRQSDSSCFISCGHS